MKRTKGKQTGEDLGFLGRDMRAHTKGMRTQSSCMCTYTHQNTKTQKHRTKNQKTLNLTT